MTQADLIMARADACAKMQIAVKWLIDNGTPAEFDMACRGDDDARAALLCAVEALEAQVNTCGSSAGCLHKDARIEALEAEVEADNRNLEQLSDEVNALRKQLAVTKQAQPERPINCGTGYCSCIECPYEQGQPERAPQEKPIAYFDFQERGFYWASNTAIGPVPVARKVEPMPLYSNQQAQPERGPLTDAELETMWASENGLEDCQLCKRDDFIKAAKYFYLKQGGAA